MCGKGCSIVTKNLDSAFCSLAQVSAPQFASYENSGTFVNFSMPPFPPLHRGDKNVSPCKAVLRIT